MDWDKTTNFWLYGDQSDVETNHFKVYIPIQTKKHFLGIQN